MSGGQVERHLTEAKLFPVGDSRSHGHALLAIALLLVEVRDELRQLTPASAPGVEAPAQRTMHEAERAAGWPEAPDPDPPRRRGKAGKA